MRVEVFVSYARKDIDVATKIISRLEQEGLIVWWDQKISPIERSTFDNQIEGAIRAARCVVVLWSEDSAKSDWVKAEATEAKNADPYKSLHVALGQRKEPPLPFNLHSCLAVGALTEGDLHTLVKAVKAVIGVHGPKEHVINPRSLGENPSRDDLAIDGPVPGTNTLLSFRPCDDAGVFLLMRYETTDGWVDSRTPTAADRHQKYASASNAQYSAENETEYLRVPNEIYLINDPLRPFTIQIGGLRSQRPSARPGMIVGNMTPEQLQMLPLQLDWLCMTLGEILSTEENLNYLWEVVEQRFPAASTRDSIRAVIARNPYSAKSFQQLRCIFCDGLFREKRRLSSKEQEDRLGAYLIANDYPFGPGFHYLAIAHESVHSWQDLTFQQLCGLNLLIHEYCQPEEHRHGAAGIEVGFNSSIRHLVLGNKTRTSAGASIPHIHKQIWGMVPRSANLAEQLICVSQAYWSYGIDYLGCYQKALMDNGYVIWSDAHVMLYVPYGQCAMHELQAMTMRPCDSFTALTTEEVISLSKAEYIALRIFEALKIGSFNQILLTKLYNDNRAPTFRLVEAFITREVDLAVSELSMLYVVDQHPWASRQEIGKEWEALKDKVMEGLETGVTALRGNAVPGT